MGISCIRRLRKGQPSRIHFHLRQVRLPLVGRNTCSFAVQALRILRCQRRRLGPWISRVERRIAVVLPRSRIGRLGLQRLLLGPLPVANFSWAPQKWGPSLREARSRPCRSPVLLGSRLKGRKHR